MDRYLLFIILAFVASVVFGLVLMPMIMKFCMKRNLYDLPNGRKVHQNAVPRLGGLAFIPCMLLAFVIAMVVLGNVTGHYSQITIGLWSGTFLVSLFTIYTVGIIDDVVGLSPKVKFIAQILSASLLPVSGLYINNLYGFCGIHDVPFIVGAPLTVFVIVFIDNAMNLIDGIDGLAGGLSLLSLLGFLACFAREGVWTYCVLIAGLMGVLVAYLYFNIFGKAERGTKIFMGDSGSLTLGFILGFLVIKFAMNNTNVMPFRNDSLLISYTLLIVPCFDVVRVIITRLRDGQPLFKADKRHIHHKLLQCGMTQHTALVTILSLALAFALLNFVLYPGMNATSVVVADIIVYTAFHLILDLVISKRKSHDTAEPASHAHGNDAA